MVRRTQSSACGRIFQCYSSATGFALNAWYQYSSTGSLQCVAEVVICVMAHEPVPILSCHLGRDLSWHFSLQLRLSVCWLYSSKCCVSDVPHFCNPSIMHQFASTKDTTQNNRNRQVKKTEHEQTNNTANTDPLDMLYVVYYLLFMYCFFKALFSSNFLELCCIFLGSFLQFS